MKNFFFRKFRIRIVRRRRRPRPGLRKQYLEHKEKARELVHARIEHFNTFYNFVYRKIAIRNQKTRWGSCSKKGNLNFNYKIALLQVELADYIIVHELCHIGEFNHSPAFWDLVSKTMPEHKRFRRELRKHHF